MAERVLHLRHDALCIRRMVEVVEPDTLAEELGGIDARQGHDLTVQIEHGEAIAVVAAQVRDARDVLCQGPEARFALAHRDLGALPLRHVTHDAVDQRSRADANGGRLHLDVARRTGEEPVLGQRRRGLVVARHGEERAARRAGAVCVELGHVQTAQVVQRAAVEGTRRTIRVDDVPHHRIDEQLGHVDLLEHLLVALFERAERLRRGIQRAPLGAGAHEEQAEQRRRQHRNQRDAVEEGAPLRELFGALGQQHGGRLLGFDQRLAERLRVVLDLGHEQAERRSVLPDLGAVGGQVVGESATAVAPAVHEAAMGRVHEGSARQERRIAKHVQVGGAVTGEELVQLPASLGPLDDVLHEGPLLAGVAPPAGHLGEAVLARPHEAHEVHTEERQKHAAAHDRPQAGVGAPPGRTESGRSHATAAMGLRVSEHGG